MRACTTCWVALVSLLQIATAVTVIAITAVQLAGVQAWDQVLNQKQCLFSADPSNTAVCTYVYAVGGVSVVFTILIGLLQLVTCNLCGCGKVMDAVFTAVAALWWLAAGFLTAHNARAANAARLKNADWRNAVVLLCWVTAGLFGLLFVTHMSRICASCARKRSKARSGSEADLEKAQLQRRDRPPSAAVELGKEVASRPYFAGRFGRGGGGDGASPAAAHLGGPNI